MFRKIDLSCPNFQQLLVDIKRKEEGHKKSMGEFYNFDFVVGEPRDGSRFRWEATARTPKGRSGKGIADFGTSESADTGDLVPGISETIAAKENKNV